MQLSPEDQLQQAGFCLQQALVLVEAAQKAETSDAKETLLLRAAWWQLMAAGASPKQPLH